VPKNILSLFLLAGIFSVGCASIKTSDSAVPFELIGTHIAVIPVVVNEKPTKFIFDTGMGPNVISKSLCEKLKCVLTGKIVDKRMSGQEMELPTAVIASLSFGSLKRENIEVAVWDLGTFPKELAGVEGFLTPKFFEHQAFTMDFFKKEISLKSQEGGTAVPLELKYKGPSVQLFAKFAVPGGDPARLEVDTGSNSLILDEKYMSRLGIKADGKNTKKSEGKDETGHQYVRYVSEFEGPIFPDGAPSLGQTPVKVMFQKIIYDGLLGTDYLRKFIVTYDLPRSQMFLSKNK
jgi:hypothetical protein